MAKRYSSFKNAQKVLRSKKRDEIDHLEEKMATLRQIDVIRSIMPKFSWKDLERL